MQNKMITKKIQELNALVLDRVKDKYQMIDILVQDGFITSENLDENVKVGLALYREKQYGIRSTYSTTTIPVTL